VTEPPEPAPWVLPLVVQLEKAAPPTRTDALEAAARAVLAILTDPRGRSGGPWSSALRTWQDGRIRKVVRRARGAAWRRAESLDSLPVDHRTARLRVYPPIPIDAWPAELAKLQVGGTELADPGELPPVAAGTALIWLSPALEMTAGKAMAQVGHAAQLGWWASSAAAREAWAGSDFAVAVRTAPPSRWAELVSSGAPAVRDAGFTEIAPGSCTAVADLPWLRSAAHAPAARG
jgi:peptidyl-tRNA hydrolase